MIKKIGIVGTGVIGRGWATQFLARGYEVHCYDPNPESELGLRSAVQRAWPYVKQMGMVDEASQDRLHVASTLEGLAHVDFVQENAPEDEGLKVDLLSQLANMLPQECIIASSSSGLLPSRLQKKCRYPERIVIGHPFNPVYLIPLVEVLGGEQTSDETIETITDFYGALGKKVLQVKKEIPGYISDRLQEALWRESLHLVADGCASTEDIDRAICEGPGLRWALMGPCLTFHLAGGEAGMAHMLEQFGPALQLPWTKLKAPELTQELTDRMVAGTKEQARGKQVAELEEVRDQFLVDLQKLLEKYHHALR